MKKTFILIAAACAASASSLFAQADLDAVAQKAQQKLDAAVARLAAERAAIGKEKIPLVTERDQLFEALRKLRAEADRAQRISDNHGADLATAQETLTQQQEMVDYLISLSAEFARTLGSQLDASESRNYLELISAAEAAAEDPFKEPQAKLAPQKAVIEAGIHRMKNLSGGAIYPGQAVTPGGLLEKGSFIRFGPVTYFASDSGVAGLAQQGQSLEPAVMTIEKGVFNPGILAVAKGEAADLPLDSTLNNAMAIAATKESLMEHISKGGIWIYPILAFAGLSLIIAAFKAFELITLPKPKEGLLADVLSKLSSNNREEAIKVANSQPGPVGKMLQQGVKYSDHDPELVEEMLYETMVETQPKVMRLLPFISVTAAVAPLLGLLGTVTGMINTFNRIKIFGTGDAKSLSGGISEALITTEFGLIVAIPSLLLYAVLSRKAKGYLARMEKISISFINGIKTIG